MIYVDEYAIVDTHYIVHAVPLLPPDEPERQDEWMIGLILHVGHQAFQVAQCYPTRSLRDAAFEKLCALMQRHAIAQEHEED